MKSIVANNWIIALTMVVAFALAGFTMIRLAKPKIVKAPTEEAETLYVPIIC